MNNKMSLKIITPDFKDSFSDFEGTFSDAESAGDTEVMPYSTPSSNVITRNIRAMFLSEKVEISHPNIENDGHIADAFDELLNSLDSLNKEIDALNWHEDVDR